MRDCSRCRNRYSIAAMFTDEETELTLPRGGPVCPPCYDKIRVRLNHSRQRSRGAATTNAKRWGE
jgi:hypothetical protein